MKRPVIDQQITFLHTPNMDQTAAFYEQIIGLPLILDQGACRIYGIGPEAFIGFCTTLGSHLTTWEPGGVILTFVTNEVDAWHDYLVSRQVVIEKRPTLNEKFQIYHLFVRDPNGYLIEYQRFLDETWPAVSRKADD